MDGVQGRRQDDPAESLYLLISGRVRLVRQDPTGREPARLEGEVRSRRCCEAKPARLPLARDPGQGL